jgi:tetratricopeptide (TPR) repeat protein/transcriptional regulator with XRE-family HTH domain
MGSFGQLLRRLRTEAGLTQEELAQAATVSTRSVSDLERGINLTARKDTARLLADALNLEGAARADFEAAARGRAGGGAAAATRTLPRDVASFTGREAELSRVADAGGAGGIYAIGGMAGVGKTAFAVHAAHLLAPLFPDGQIFLPLHGHTPGQRPVQPEDALASLLQTIGVAPQQIPPGLEARTSLWRDYLAGKRLLLVLDDAVDSDHVRPLLPGTAGSLVLVTSRRHLTALEDARAVSLDTLPREEAAGLLARLAARPGLDASDPAVAEITRLCGCLPLALGMVARQLCHHPAWSPADLAADMAAARDRLALIHAENLSVAAAFDRSYQDLTGAGQRMFRRLGLHPGTDFDAWAASALAGISVAEARRELESLYDHYLLTEPARGRYRFHDLIRERARGLAAADPPAEQDSATARLLDYYVHTAHMAGRHLSTRISATAPVTPPEHARKLSGRDDALTWLGAERLNLHAAVGYATASGRPGHAAAIPAAMREFWRGQGHWDQAAALHQAALEAAHAAGNQLAEARALTDLGDMQLLTDDYPEAAASLRRALDLYRGLDDRLGEASALTSLGAVQHAAGDSPAATASLSRALELYSSLADRLGEAGALTSLGAVQQATGDSPAATASLTRALELYRAAGDRLGEAGALTELGTVQYFAGEYSSAVTSQEQALELYRRLGERLGEANALTDLSIVQHLTGQQAAATASLTRALDLYRDLGDRSGEADALINIAEMTLASATPAEARSYYERALDIAVRITAPSVEARALEGLGLCFLGESSQEQGSGLLRKALSIYQRIGSPRARQVEKTLQEISHGCAPPSPSGTPCSL